MKKFILNADNFGVSKDANRAVLEGYHNGFLTAASLCANGAAFNAAVNEIIPECPKLGVGVHLNITEGKSLTKAGLITNKKGKFNKKFIQLLFLSHNKNVLEQIEFEFRTQIETVMNYTKVDHIDSNDNIHMIPDLFNITSKLAKEYNIPYIRKTYEELYFVPSIKKNLNLKLLVNIINLLSLNLLSLKIPQNAKTNNYFIGIGYNGIMDDKAIEYGLKVIDDENCIVEAVINPLHNTRKNSEFKEFMLSQNKELKDKILRLGYDITTYKNE